MVFVKIHPHKLIQAMQKGTIPINHVDQNNAELPIYKLHFKDPKKSGSVAKKLNSGKNVRVKLHELHNVTDHQGKGFFDAFKSIGKSIIGNKDVQNIAKGLLTQAASTGIDALGARVGAPSAVTDIAKGLTSTLIDKGVDSGATAAAGSGFRRMTNMRGRGLTNNPGTTDIVW